MVIMITSAWDIATTDGINEKGLCCKCTMVGENNIKV